MTAVDAAPAPVAAAPARTRRVPVWLAVVALTRISSLGGMSAALAGPLAAWALGRGELIVPLAGIALVVLWRHRANIARLRAGTEPRIGQKG